MKKPEAQQQCYSSLRGMRISWEVYIISNGYRVNFDDPAGCMVNPDIEVWNGGTACFVPQK